MPFASTVTQKGQITIPKDLREMLSIQKYSRVRFQAEKNYLKVFPEEDILDLAGKYKPKTKKSVLKAREKFEKTYQRF